MNIIEALAEEFNWDKEQIQKTVEMLDEGNTVPFIARYRKEVTGSMSDEMLRKLEDRLNYLRHLDERREEISASITAQEKMTEELASAIAKASTLVELEDLYLPYRPKRKTRASVAREKGLEPLSALLMEQRAEYGAEIEALAADFVDAEKGVEDAKAALAGALDIIAEDVSDTADYRKMLRAYVTESGSLSSKAAKEEDSVYADYYDFSEPISKIRPHRVLAINRGEKEGFLKVSVDINAEEAIAKLTSAVLTNPTSPAAPHLSAAVADSFERLIFPAIEREIRNTLFDDAAEGALQVFSENLKNLLLIAPVKGKTVLGFDPGYAHGCKLAVVDKTGKYMTSTVIYPTKPREDTARAARVLEETGSSVEGLSAAEAAERCPTTLPSR